MPTYEYACPTCGIVEAFQSIKEAPLKKCPQCKKAKVQRMVSLNSGVIFKGSGFWETDYNRSADYKKQSADAAGAKPKDESGTKKDGDKDAGKTKKPAANDTPTPKPQPQPAPATAPAKTGPAPAKK